MLKSYTIVHSVFNMKHSDKAVDISFYTNYITCIYTLYTGINKLYKSGASIKIVRGNWKLWTTANYLRVDGDVDGAVD